MTKRKRRHTRRDEAFVASRRIAELAYDVARREGCTCLPEILTTEVEPGLWDTKVAHDNTCPLMRRLRAPRN